MPNYVKPDIVQKFSGVKVGLWHWLEENIGNQDGTFELNQSKLAEKFDVSRKSIQNALKTFISANLLEKVESRTGRGVHSLYKLIWTFRERSELKNKKSATPGLIYSNPKKKTLTKVENQDKIFSKGTKVYRYYAMKFREAVEESTLANHAHDIVSTLIDHLKGKPVAIAKTFLIYLCNWLDEKHKYLGEFFLYFRDTLISLAQAKLSTIRQQREIEQKREKREKIQKEYQENPPPKSSDFTRFSDYLEAMEAWESEGSDRQVENEDKEANEVPSLMELLDEQMGNSEGASKAC